MDRTIRELQRRYQQTKDLADLQTLMIHCRRAGTSIPVNLLQDAVDSNLLPSYEIDNHWTFCCAWSPDGSQLVSGSDADSGDLKLWSNSGVLISTTTLTLELEVDDSPRFCAWAPDGDGIAIISSTYQSLKLWRGISWDNPRIILGSGVWCCAWSPDGSLLERGVDSGSLGVWNKSSNTYTVIHHGRPIRSCSWSPDGELLAFGGVATLRILKVKGWEEVSLIQHTAGAECCAWSPDGSLLASGDVLGDLKLWNRLGGEVLTFPHGNLVELLAWSPDGNLLVSASESILRLWSKFGEEVAVLEGHHGWVRCCAWSPDGSLLATGGEDGTLRFLAYNSVEPGFGSEKTLSYSRALIRRPLSESNIVVHISNIIITLEILP